MLWEEDAETLLRDMHEKEKLIVSWLASLAKLEVEYGKITMAMFLWRGTVSQI